MTVTIGLDEIPGPRGVPLLGNVFDIDTHNPIEGLHEDGPEYGPIFRLDTPAGTRLIVSGADLVEEICDDTPLRQAGRGRAAPTCARTRWTPGCSPRTRRTRCGSARTTS